MHIKSIKIKYQSHLLLNILIWLNNTIGFNNFHQVQDFRDDYLFQWSIGGIATDTETINYVCQNQKLLKEFWKARQFSCCQHSILKILLWNHFKLQECSLQKSTNNFYPESLTEICQCHTQLTLDTLVQFSNKQEHSST